MSKRKIDWLANFFALLYSLLLALLFAQYLNFGFLGLGKLFIVLSVIGWVLVLMCCASFFTVANAVRELGGRWLISGLLLNFALTYAYLMLWKLSYLFFYTTLGQMADIRLDKIMLLKGIVLYAVSYMMMCYGAYEMYREKEKAPALGNERAAGAGDNGDNI